MHATRQNALHRHRRDCRDPFNEDDSDRLIGVDSHPGDFERTIVDNALSEHGVVRHVFEAFDDVGEQGYGCQIHAHGILVPHSVSPNCLIARLASASPVIGSIMIPLPLLHDGPPDAP